MIRADAAISPALTRPPGRNLADRVWSWHENGTGVPAVAGSLPGGSNVCRREIEECC
ncbi:MAG: hypothetical protein JO110_20790 [Acetobacteraceae bacterium]|nr:hypothetical protein [Acetobacteraceae bacterium]